MGLSLDLLKTYILCNQIGSFFSDVYGQVRSQKIPIIYHKDQPKRYVGKYTSPMDGPGMICIVENLIQLHKLPTTGRVDGRWWWLERILSNRWKATTFEISSNGRGSNSCVVFFFNVLFQRLCGDDEKCLTMFFLECWLEM